MLETFCSSPIKRECLEFLWLCLVFGTQTFTVIRRIFWKSHGTWSIWVLVLSHSGLIGIKPPCFQNAVSTFQGMLQACPRNGNLVLKHTENDIIKGLCNLPPPKVSTFGSSSCPRSSVEVEFLKYELQRYFYFYKGRCNRIFIGIITFGAFMLSFLFK